MLNLFTKLFEFFSRAAEPDEPEDGLDFEDEALWNFPYSDRERQYRPDPFEPERNELYENIGGKRYA